MVPKSIESPRQARAKLPEIPGIPKMRNSESFTGSNTEPTPNRTSYSLRERGSTEDLSTPKRLNSLDINGTSNSGHKPLRNRSASVPDLTGFSCIRVHDLDIAETAPGFLDTGSEASSSSQMGAWLNPPDPVKSAKDAFFSIDRGMGSVLDALIRFGHDIVTDESERLRPMQNTERLLAKTAGQEPPESWPVRPWHITSGSDILVWRGSTHHPGPRKDLPVIKARGIVPATPELVMGLLLDSSRVAEYNKMSQGREDLLFLQKGLHTSAADSDYHCGRSEDNSSSE
jgi:hypothetical protein